MNAVDLFVAFVGLGCFFAGWAVGVFHEASRARKFKDGEECKQGWLWANHLNLPEDKSIASSEMFTLKEYLAVVQARQQSP